jgi:hypothetical protein
MKFFQHFFRTISGKELTREKANDFVRTVIAQVILIGTLFILELFAFLNFPLYLEIAECLFFAALGFYVFQLWDMLRNFTSSRRIIVMNFVFIIGVFLAGMIGVNPFYVMAPNIPYRIFLALVQVCLLTVESTLIYFTIREFFKKDLGLSVKLWGAACLYLMIGFAFGSFYEILCTIDLHGLGVDIPLRTIALMKRIGYSLAVLSGMDTPYGVSGMIYMTSVIESLVGQLYIVLIVGRLLLN